MGATARTAIWDRKNHRIGAAEREVITFKKYFTGEGYAHKNSLENLMFLVLSPSLQSSSIGFLAMIVLLFTRTEILLVCKKKSW